MIGIRRSHILPIGIDVGYDSVKLLQLEASAEGQLSVVAAARQALPEEARHQPIEIIRRLMRSADFVGRRAVLALPRDIVHVKNLRLPQMPVSELASAVEFEARNVFEFDTDHAQVRFLYAGEVRQGNEVREEVIVLAAGHDPVDEFVEQLHRSDVIVESLDFEPAAVYRCVERFIRRKEDEAEVNVLVDLGSRRTQVIIGRGRDISFFKPIEIGGQHLNESVSRKLGITMEEARGLRRRLIESANATDSNPSREPVRQAVYDATRSIIEDLAREISLCLRYYSVTFRGQRPTRVRLLGGEACDGHLQSILAANLPIGVEPLRPLNSVNTSRMKTGERRGCMSEWGVALGLGLKLTQQRFDALAGAKRGSAAQVLDLSQAVQEAAHA
jgi:type IV pilus assembly protein PilM